MDARDAFEGAKDLGEGEVLGAEDVLFADPPEPRGEQMPAGHVGHVNQVETGIEGGEHPSVEIVQHHPPGGGGLHLPRADGVARVDDDHGQPARGELLGHALGQKLGALVVADHVVEAHRGGLGARAPVPGESEGAHARGIDHAADIGALAGLEHGARAVHVVAFAHRR